MNIKMECNDYVLAWNILFKNSLTDNMIETKSNDSHVRKDSEI